MLKESEALELLRAAHGRGPRGRGVLVGIGDDCAVLAPTGRRQVWTVDACIEGVHYRPGWLTPADIAYRSLNAAVSDLAAMGAEPVGALCHLTLTPELGRAELAAFAEAQADAARELGCPIVGGNLSAGSAFAAVTSVLGRVPRRRTALSRAGARPGQELWLLGSLGLARLGLALLEGPEAARSLPGAPACLLAFRRPRALLAAGRGLLGRASACLDVSDGLRRDAQNLASASGVRVVLDAGALLAGADAALGQVAPALGLDPLEVLLDGGEDYALLASGPEGRRPRGARPIGRIEAGQGVVLVGVAPPRELSGGFEHGA